MAVQGDKLEDNQTIKDNTNDKHKGNKGDNKHSLSCMNRKHLKLCAWMVITMGLCITLTISNIVFMQNYENSHAEISTRITNLKLERSYLHYDNEDGHQRSIGSSLYNSEANERSSIVGAFEKTTKTNYECQEEFCKISCMNVVNLNGALQKITQDSHCSFITLLLLDEQEFTRGILPNFWAHFNINIKEVIIYTKHVTTIESHTFNAPSLRKTVSLKFTNSRIIYFKKNALAGLDELKYLTIKCPIKKFKISTLVPLQANLMHLELNAQLQVQANKNFFGACFMKSLVYLDLSNNIFKGTLGREMFASTPNLKYLIITESRLQYIDKDAFENLAGKLLFVDLSHNRLTTLDFAVLRPILVGEKHALINLINNDWICNCQIQGLAELCKSNNFKFIDLMYCKEPFNLYGVPLKEVDFEKLNCFPNDSTEYNTERSSEQTTTKYKETATDDNDGNKPNATANTFKMRCLHCEHESRAVNSLETPLESLRRYTGSIEISPPNYDFELQLLTENNSVIVHVDKNISDVVVLWFSDQLESSSYTYKDTTLDYECMSYAVPKLMIGPLQDNTTYTFCLLPSLAKDISPFNCLPLYVPPKSHENLWIAENQKEFTIGMLCLIFLLSTLAGALIAYFGIKTYPDLLEGSKNVVVVKKPKRVNYIATISEREYEKHAAFRATKLWPKQQPINKNPLLKTPTSEVLSRPCCMSVNDLKRLSTFETLSTCFEEMLPSYNVADDEDDADYYAKPTECNDEYMVVQNRSAPNAYCTPPTIPPPLPKRNSDF